MTREIYDAICESIDCLKKYQAAIVERAKARKTTIIKVGLFSAFFLVSISGLKLCNNISNRKLSGAQNVALVASFDYASKTPAVHSKVNGSRHQIIQEPSKTQIANLQSKIEAENDIHIVKSKRPNEENLSLDVSSNTSEIVLEDLNTVFSFLNRYAYFGTRPIELDPSRVELRDPLGFHAPTSLRIGMFQTTFRIPGIPKTTMIKWDKIVFDLCSKMLPEGPVKSVVASLMESVTIGPFRTEIITTEGDHPSSRAMFHKIRTEQEHHTLMRRQFDSMVRFLPRPILYGMLRYLMNNPHVHSLNDNNANDIAAYIPAAPLNESQIYETQVGLKTLLFPRYGVSRRIPQFHNTENRFLILDDQIKSISQGIVYQVNVVPITLKIFRQRAPWAEYLQRHVEIYFKRTHTDVMNTSLIETRINVTKVLADSLRSMTVRTPVLKTLYPIVHAVAVSTQELMPLEMYFQVGHQHSIFNGVNFNQTQDWNKTILIDGYNLHIHNQLNVLHGSLCHRPVIRQHLNIDGMPETHSRSFYDLKFMLTYNVNIFDILERLTANKNKPAS